MDQSEHAPQRGAPRSSRLPLPRSAIPRPLNQTDRDNSKAVGSKLPRPLATSSLRLKSPASLTEGLSQTYRSRYGWTGSQAQDSSTFVNLAGDVQVVSLETTPPAPPSIQYVEGDENSNADGNIVGKQKRKPRPSLSERTLETLSQVPPSPSPSRRRPSFANGVSNMRPPSRPASSLGGSRSTTNERARSLSPSKRSSGSSYQGRSDYDQPPPVPPMPDVGRFYTSRGELNKGRNAIANDPTERIKSEDQVQDRRKKPSLYASKAKTVHDMKGSTKKLSTRPSLASIFQDPPIHDPVKTTSSPSPFGMKMNNTPLNPKSSRQTAKSPFSTQVPEASPSINGSRNGHHETRPLNGSVRGPPSKSSATLRETIAKAKAAKREANKPTEASIAMDHDGVIAADYEIVFGSPLVANSTKTLQKRLDSAVTTGFLNLAATGLKILPNEILKMYDFSENHKISWAEAVDVTKFIAADNELEVLPDVFFPDWSLEELENDDDKVNQFGGLEILNFRGNLLSDLPTGFRRLTRLHTLDLSNNKLVVRNLETICQISSLKELNLSNNNLAGGMPSSFEFLSELQVLDLHSNRLTVMTDELAKLQKLRKLDLSDNRLSYIPLSSLQSAPLLDLNLSKNNLSGCLFTAPFQSQKLRVLDVSFNQLQSLSKHDFDFPSLQSLNCDNNQIEELPNLSFLRSLTSLTAAENKIENLPNGFVALPELRNVNLNDNLIRTLDPLIANMVHLVTLNIAANPLRDRKYLNMDTSEIKASLSKRLEVDTDTAGYPEQEIASNTHHGASSSGSGHIYKPEKGILDLSSRNISLIKPSMIDLSRPIHSLRLSNNDLATFPIDLLTHPMVGPSLKSLDVSHNQVLHPRSYLEEDISLPALESLYVVSTGLTTLESLLSHLSAPCLKELNISCHRLTGPVPNLRAMFPCLTTLLATDNWFTSIDVEHIRGLEVLDIRNNSIDHLPPKIGELGNLDSNKTVAGRLRAFECSGNGFRVPRSAILERGTEATLKDLRRMVPLDQVGDEWRE